MGWDDDDEEVEDWGKTRLRLSFALVISDREMVTEKADNIDIKPKVQKKSEWFVCEFDQ